MRPVIQTLQEKLAVITQKRKQLEREEAEIKHAIEILKNYNGTFYAVEEVQE